MDWPVKQEDPEIFWHNIQKMRLFSFPKEVQLLTEFLCICGPTGVIYAGHSWVVFLSSWFLHQLSLWLWRSLLHPTAPYSLPETGDEDWMTHVMFSTGTGGINPRWWSKSCGSSSSCKGTLDPHCWTWDEAPAVWSVADMTLSLPLS